MNVRPILAIAALTFASPALGKGTPQSAPYGSAAAEEAFVYGYPLVLMDATQHQMTSAPPESGFSAPVNQFRHVDRTAGPADRVVVRPNTDTLYSSAWLDLSAEPIVLHVPEIHNRYYLMQLMDAWTNVFAAPGTRTTGSAARDFVVVGPRFTGSIPAGLAPIKAPTSMVWLLGRTQILGANDLPIVQAIQQQYTLTPLHAWGQPTGPVAPPIESAQAPALNAPALTPPQEIAQLDGVSFLRRLSELVRNNPPAFADAPLLQRLSTIGFFPGQPFKPGPELIPVLDDARQRAFEHIAAASQQIGTRLNGWQMLLHGVGQYGTNYLRRAAVAMIGLGANLPEDAVYGKTSADATGQPLSGDRRYVLHFAPGQLPPVRAFWSLTLYDKDGYLVPNALGRYAIHDRDALHVNADGSLDLYLQSDSPGADRESNWLPTPAGAPFNLLLRLYWPRAAVLQGWWTPPPVVEQVLPG